MTEDEAIATISEQFAGQSGLIANLRRGEGLNPLLVDGIFTALDVLESAWAGNQSVPKRAVWAMAHVDDAIGSQGDQYPDLDLEMLEIRLVEHIEQCLAPSDWGSVNLSSDAASPEGPWLYAFYSGADESFLMKLHGGQGVDESIVTDLFDALDVLRLDWSGQERIQKAIAYVLATASGFVSGRWGIYRNNPRQGQRILDLAGEMQGRIIRCLSDGENSEFVQMKMDLTG